MLYIRVLLSVRVRVRSEVIWNLLINGPAVVAKLTNLREISKLHEFCEMGLFLVICSRVFNN